MRISLRLLLPIVTGLALLAVPARAQGSDSTGVIRSDPEHTDLSAVRISLLTIQPGTEIYSLWGHSAIRVVDPSHAALPELRDRYPRLGADMSFNYGTFDFETDYFVARFLHGNLDYQLSLHDMEAALEHYRLEDRTVIEQTLDLTHVQKARLLAFLEINMRPDNRNYRYHFLFDNCSTRVRDAIEAAFDGSLQFDETPDGSLTFRELIDPYQDALPFLDAGIDWLLGIPVDRTARPYETMFLPDHLMREFDQARIGDTNHPLVVATDTLYTAERTASTRLPWAVWTAWILFAGAAFATLNTSGLVRAVDAPLFVVVGCAGCLIAYLWFVSHHDVTEKNWHLLWSWPTHLAAGILLMRRKTPTWLRAYVIAAGVSAGLALVALTILPQSVHPALTPIVLLLVLRGGAVFRASRRAGTRV